MSICAPYSGFLTAEDLAREDQWCCAGAAMGGPGRCTCWEPVFDMEQLAPLPDPVWTTRRTRCHDCAFRPDSPERAAGEDPEDLPNFSCHQGMRRAVGYRHPDGRYRDAGPGDYQPAMTEAGAFKADGTPADLCAGWAQSRRILLTG